MAWFSGKVSLGNFPDLAGAVNKLQESVKNIEKNFDTALGFEEKDKLESGNEASGVWSPDRKVLFDPVMSFMGQKSEDDSVEKPESSESPSKVEKSSAELESSPKVEVTSVEPKSLPEAVKSSVEPESPPKDEKSSVEPKSPVENSSVEHESPRDSAQVEEKDGATEKLSLSVTERTDAEEGNKVAEEEMDENHAETVQETKNLKSGSQLASVPVESPEPARNSTASDSVDSQEIKISEGVPSETSESVQGIPQHQIL